MASALIILKFLFIMVYGTYTFYLAVMSLLLAQREGKLTKQAKFFGYPILVVGLCFDFVLNIVVASVVFLELPKELLLTKRLSRLISTDMGWRGDFAEWLCTKLLDYFDPNGVHCHNKRLTK